MKKLALLLIGILFLVRIFAQSAPSKPEEKVPLFFEKVYLSTDRAYYASGETIWYTAFLVDAQSNLPGLKSNNLYVELIDEDKKVIDRKVLFVEAGIGKGDIQLGDSIAAGSYNLRAYTHWMRNFEDAFIFQKSITIVNVLKSKNTVKTVATSVGSQSVNFSSSARISFLPEGGSLIDDVPCVLAFKAEDSNGKGIEAEGNIFSSKGEQVASFKTSFNGMGKFLFQPKLGESYHAKGIYLDGSKFAVPLTSLDKGFNVLVRQRDSSFLVAVKTNVATFSGMQEKVISLVVRNKGKAYFSVKLPLQDIQGSILVPKKNLPDGICSITLYDDLLRPVCERLVYVDANPVNISISSGKAVYAPKEKGKINISLTDQFKKPLAGVMTVSAYDASLIPQDLQANIISYLNLASELKGNLENPSAYFDKGNTSKTEQLDLLLLCSGWRDFLWKRLVQMNKEIKFNAEQGFTFSGRVEDINKKPLANQSITLAALKASGNKLFFSSSNSEGNYYIDGVKLFGYQPIKVTSLNGKMEKKGWVYINRFDKEILEPTFPHKPLVQVTKLAVEKLAERADAKSKFSLSDTIQLKEVKIGSIPDVKLIDGDFHTFGYKPESFEIQPSDYSYTNLEHFLSHRLNMYSVIVRSGSVVNPKYPRIIVNGRDLPYSDEDPSEMVQDYIDVYYNLTMDKIKSVKVERRLGIDRWTGKRKEIYVLWLKVDMDGVRALKQGVNETMAQGYYEAREFYKPNYSGVSKATDVRTTIHWEPKLITDGLGNASVSFFNADPKAKIQVVAEGISLDGRPFYGTTSYEVK